MTKPDPMCDPTPDPDPVTPVRRWALPLGLVGLIALVFVLGRAGLGPRFGDGSGSGLEEALANLQTLAGSPLALPALIVAFCVGAFIGVPQFVLVGASVLAFGPWLGFAYAWIAGLCSGSLTFVTGRWVGADMLERRARGRLARLRTLIHQNAFTASAIVRTLPAGPFLFVNMAFGALGARFLPFLAGLGAGSVPKLALIAFAGESLVAALTGSVWRALAAGALTILLWLAFGALYKRALPSKEAGK